MHFTYEKEDMIWAYRDACRVLLIALACAASGMLTGAVSSFLVSRFVEARERASINGIAAGSG